MLKLKYLFLRPFLAPSIHPFIIPERLSSIDDDGCRLNEKLFVLEWWDIIDSMKGDETIILIFQLRIDKVLSFCKR